MEAVSPALEQYFTGFNRADYDGIAALFAPEGVLVAPFTAPVIGPAAIRDYLRAEAVQMQAVPLAIETVAPAAGGDRTAVIHGRVKARLFTVNVRWTFVLSVVAATDRIQSVEVRLLASLQDLLHLDRGR